MPNIKVLSFVVSGEKIYSCCHCISLCKTCDVQGESTFAHRGKIVTNLVYVH